MSDRFLYSFFFGVPLLVAVLFLVALVAGVGTPTADVAATGAAYLLLAGALGGVWLFGWMLYWLLRGWLSAGQVLGGRRPGPP